MTPVYLTGASTILTITPQTTNDSFSQVSPQYKEPDDISLIISCGQITLSRP